ncbi:hypothetical protein M3J09_010163 [Ascochyta lentis]
MTCNDMLSQWFTSLAHSQAKRKFKHAAELRGGVPYFPTSLMSRIPLHHHAQYLASTSSPSINKPKIQTLSILPNQQKQTYLTTTPAVSVHA